MIRINQLKIQLDLDKETEESNLKKILLDKAAKILRISTKEISDLKIIRHSIDARKKPEIFHMYMVDVSVKGGNENSIIKKSRDKNVTIVKPCEYSFMDQVNKLLPENVKADKEDVAGKEVVVIGAGPAGLFCAYMLSENGCKVVVFERGLDVDSRIDKVGEFWNGGKLDVNTNVQFGEGGAGTFSDGKLNTMVKDKDGRGKKALEIFVENGAKDNILYESKPHIGTDILCSVVKNMRKHIENNGGEIHFGSRVSDFIFDSDNNLSGITVNDRVYPCSTAVLAIGHSARDTFFTLHERNVEMQKKPFAVGFRVEHPQKLINKSQYGIEDPKALPAAPYKLVAKANDGRGVYSFCMCPGGYVVNASSEEGRLAVNGMSYNARDGLNANSAIIITVDPKDFGGDDCLAGVEFQRRLEEKAYNLGKGKIPVEYYCDFKKAVLPDEKESGKVLENKQSGNLPQMKGAYCFADVHSILPEDLNIAFVEGMTRFGGIIEGYDNDDVLISGVESRTSSPVRITRDAFGESVSHKGLYPCGEGAGYAGGIMSAAMDGMQIAEHIFAHFVNKGTV